MSIQDTLVSQVNSLPIRPIRVRIAPSPTGHLHVGTLRAALFNWLFARHNKGAFLLRIEDTDKERSKPEYTQEIFESLAWAGLAADETPVIQSQRIERHKQVIAQMLANGTAYYCYCTPQELQERLGFSAAQEGNYAFYDNTCRLVADKQADKQIDKPCVVRFKVPRDNDTITFHDLIHGDISFATDQFDDFIIMRSDGTPMYNFVVVVDDADMGITHVIRGEDHIPNTPKQILLYKACAFALPQFAHLPLILGPAGNKLSKRDAAVSVLDYRKNGFLAAALCNYLVRLGWSHGDQEIFTTKELIALFSLKEVNKKGSIFDIKKLEWINGLYIRQHQAYELIDFIISDIDPLFKTRLASWDVIKIAALIDLYKDRVKTLKELMQEIESVYYAATAFIPEDINAWINKSTYELLEALIVKLEEQENFTAQELAQLIKDFCVQKQVALQQVAKPVRLALTGKSSSPGIYELLALIGKQESIRRLHFFLESIRA